MKSFIDTTTTVIDHLFIHLFVSSIVELVKYMKCDEIRDYIIDNQLSQSIQA